MTADSWSKSGVVEWTALPEDDGEHLRTPFRILAATAVTTAR